MLNIKNVLPITLLILASIGLISFFTISHIQSLRKLNQNANDVSFYLYDEEDSKRAIEEEIKLSKYHKAMQAHTIRHLSLSDLEKERLESSGKNFRSLAESNLFDDVGIVNPNKDSFWWLSYWITTRLKQFSSNIVVYPYFYQYSPDDSPNSTVNYTQGSYISLNPSELSNYNNIGLKTNKTLSVQKARALFGADIAILSVLGQFDDDDTIDYFYDGADWCTYLTSIGKPNCLDNFQVFNATKSKNSGATYATMINQTDLLDGRLLNDGIPRFRILIIPDFLYGVYERLKEKIKGTSGFQKIKEFFDSGGVIFATGKSGIILEEAGLVARGTYDSKTLLSVDNNEKTTTVTGCDETYFREYKKDADDFEKQMACVTINKYTKVGLSTTFLTKKLDTKFKTLIDINPNQVNLSIASTEDFVTIPIKEDQKKILPLLSFRSNEKDGQIFLMNFNPVFERGSKNIAFNLLALAMSKELYLTSKVNMAINSTISDLPIPAGEAGVNLQVKTTIHNLNDELVSNCKLYVFLPDNFGWTNTPKDCSLNDNSVTLPKSVLQKKSFKSSNKFLICDIKNIEAYEKKDFVVTISVLNYLATQMKYQVQILEPIAVLTSNKKEITLVDYVRVNCEAAPLLRVAANPDPSGFYPVFGTGEYVDNVIKIENKEQSNAYEVEYVGLIPIITPLLDGDDQRKTDWALKIYAEYYNGFNFEVPLRSDNATDYIYSGYLQGKGSKIVAEWDSPVLPVKELVQGDMIKKSAEGLKQDLNISGINIGLITLNKTSEVIKQVNYRKSDRFYKLASQRLMVFIDDSTPEGAKTLYGSSENIPKEWKDPIYNDRAKREFLFLRNDIYFYENENYCNPPGVTEKIVFSVDKLVEYKSHKSGCKSKRGEARSQIIKDGYFDNFDPNHREKILEPNIYSNELFEYCDLEVIDPTDEEAIKNRFGNSTNLRPVHYIIPNVEENVTSAKQIYNFESDEGDNGHHKVYKSIKFIYLHSTTIKIDAKKCLYGGKMIVDLKDNKLNKVDDVTVSPDQIAVFKTEYVDGKIIIYFRRGLMSNEQFGKDLTIGINIENLDAKNALNLDLTIEEMIYDISIPELEKYVKVSSNNVEFKYTTAFSYPALEVKTKLDRDLNGYETMEPFSRYGTYSQDIEHRYIWGTAETHHQTKPGVTGNTGGFSIISNLGISSIPFIEYMTVGKGQVIPSGTSTARATWKDVWGRTWHQPIRSLFPDIPPIPPPLKNFMMSTTYEILRGKDQQQIQEWPSDENVQIHLHIKLLNNYPKYFEITRCKENEIQFVPRYLDENHDREYSNTSSVRLLDNDIKNDLNTFLRQGGFASYGICFSDENAYVGGKKVEGELRTMIERAKVCADYTDENMIAECFKELENITTLHRISEEEKLKNYTKWNYSPRVESYYPINYIEDDMWDLTHVDYDDNAMDKAYKYHMDNHLPNYDNKIIKPHNTIAIPIYKGLGYSITYNKDYSMKYHGANKKGWWCDNLQNRDDTLVAGQTACNKVSVDKPISLNNWVKGTELKGNDATSDQKIKEIVNSRNKNIYVCMYNQKRPQFKKGNKIKYATLNVNQNNVVPILVDLDRYDSRLTNFNCDQEQVDPDNLRNVEGNLLVTPTSKDYLYFAANLRGQAKEAFNVLMRLEYFDKIKYEGMVKVNEGGRFVYWNPANGPNSFLVVDNPVSIVNSKRNDIEVTNILFPQRIKTFDSIVYHHYTFRDENKINKVWPFDSYYANSYGYGDLAVSVYVGGIRKSRAVVEKGTTTYVRIIIFNNCGFDLEMKANAIEADEIGKKAISAYDLLERLVHTIRRPTSYNFLNYTVEEKYQKYIKIGPSDHNIDVPPEFFDFENINVVTIRDGFKGEYNLQVNISKDFPDELRGKPIEIKISLNTSYFEHFPGTETDLVKEWKTFRNYREVKIPSAYIALPYAKGEFEGKVLYTSAYASKLDFNIKLSSDWDILGVKYVDNKTLEDFLNTLQGDEVSSNLDKKWDALKTNTVRYEEKLSGFEKTINFTGFSQNITQFPIPKGNDPDIADVSIILKTRVNQIEKGRTKPLKSVELTYYDWINKRKTSKGREPFVDASGPWVRLTYTRQLVEKLPNGTYIPSVNQELTHESEGIMRIYFLLTNSGNGDAYNTTYSILLDSNLTYLDCLGVNYVQSRKDDASGKTELTFDLNSGIPAGQAKGGYIYVHYSKYIDSYSSLTPEELKGLPSTLEVANQSTTHLKVTNETDGKLYSQVIRTSIVFKYQNNNIFPYLDLIVSGRRSNPNIEVVPKINLANNPEAKEILTNISKTDWTKYEAEEYNKLTGKNELLIKNKFYRKNAEDKPITLEYENKEHVVTYYISARIGDKNTQNKLSYVQKDIGLSTAEVVLIIISICFFALAGFFIWAGVKNMKLIRSNGTDPLLENKVKSSNLDQLLNE